MNDPSEIRGQRAYGSPGFVSAMAEIRGSGGLPKANELTDTPPQSLQDRVQQYEKTLDAWSGVLDYISGEMPNTEMPNGDGALQVMVRLDLKAEQFQRRLNALAASVGALYASANR